MKIHKGKTMGALALLILAAEAVGQSGPPVNAIEAFNRRLTGNDNGVTERRLAEESSAIVLFRADANQDGGIDEGEFVDAEVIGVDERFGSRDRDGDGVLTRDEVGPDSNRPERERPGLDVNVKLYRLCMQEADGDEPVHEDRFAEADLNGDGVLTFEEFSIHLEERAHTQFARLDDNQDGVLTFAELTDNLEHRRRHARLARACRELASDTTF